MTRFIAFASVSILLAAVACGTDHAPASSVAADAGAGAEPAAGAASNDAGGEGGDDGFGGAGAAAACQSLAGSVFGDVNIGPGCVDLDATTIFEGTLTIEPGTTVRVQAGGSLEIFSSATLIANGTESAPITFTSAYDEPSPGDWQCVLINSGSSATEVENVVFEYGGAPCEANGAGESAMVQLNASARSFRHVKIQNSSGHGLLLGEKAVSLRDLSDLTFANNADVSLVADAQGVNAIRPPIVLDEDDDHIEVRADSPSDIQVATTFRNLGAPYRIANHFDVDKPLTVEAGTRIELASALRFMNSGSLQALGTQDKPIVWTGAPGKRVPGGWGCLHFWQSDESHLSYNRIEYAGGSCAGSSGYGMFVEAPVTFDHLQFAHIGGSALRLFSACDTLDAELTDWCGFEFEDVTRKLQCSSQLSEKCK